MLLCIVLFVGDAILRLESHLRFRRGRSESKSEELLGGSISASKSSEDFTFRRPHIWDPTTSRMINKDLLALLLLLCLVKPSGGGVAFPSPLFPHVEEAIVAAQAECSELDLAPGIVRLDDGSHTVKGGTLRLRGTQQGMAGSRGGEGETRITGEWHLAGGSGNFANVAVLNRRWPERYRTPVQVINISGGAWGFDQCEIAGEGTGMEAHALVSVDFANATFKACVVHNLQGSDGGNLDVPVHNVMYIGDGACVEIDDSEVSGGMWYCFYLFGPDSNITIRDSLIHKTNVAFALDDATTLKLHKCVIRDVSSVFHVWSAYVTVSLRRNKITGQLFEDDDRFTNSTFSCKHNTLDPAVDPREAACWECECGHQHAISTLGGVNRVIDEGGEEAAEMKEYFRKLWTREREQCGVKMGHF